MGLLVRGIMGWGIVIFIGHSRSGIARFLKKIHAQFKEGMFDKAGFVVREIPFGLRLKHLEQVDGLTHAVKIALDFPGHWVGKFAELNHSRGMQRRDESEEHGIGFGHGGMMTRWASPVNTSAVLSGTYAMEHNLLLLQKLLCPFTMQHRQG